MMKKAWKQGGNFYDTPRTDQPENFEAVIALQAAPEQSKFVASNLYSIAQAKVYPECVALAAFDNDQAVGFAMYCPIGQTGNLDPAADGEWDCQRKGFGEVILHGVLQRIMADLSRHRVYISFEPDNHAARA